MKTDAYPAPKDCAVQEHTVKKSRFISLALQAENREAAMRCLHQLRQQYADARHHCWAYRIGPPHSPTAAAMSDDGEPGGTAGKPILKVLEHKGVGDVMLVVVRYFGGIKLGTGGLVRAYTASAELAMQAVNTQIKRQLTCWRIQADYAVEQSLRHWLSTHHGVLIAVQYCNDVQMTVQVPAPSCEALRAWLHARGAQMLPLASPL